MSPHEGAEGHTPACIVVTQRPLQRKRERVLTQRTVRCSVVGDVRGGAKAFEAGAGLGGRVAAPVAVAVVEHGTQIARTHARLPIGCALQATADGQNE